MEVGRSLDELDQKIKKVNDSLKQSTAQTRELDKAIKLDSSNTEAVATKMKNLQTEIGLCTQKVALLKQKQIEANKAFANGDLTAKEFSKIQVAVLKAENELVRYNNELKQVTDAPKIQKIEKMSQGFDKVTSSLQKTQKVLSTVSKLTIGLVTTVTASITAFTNQTNALNENAKALEVNIEKLQLQRNIYKEITGDASNYDSALNSLKGVMNSITLGQGSAYLNILNRLGVSTTDLEGNTKQLSTIYDEVLESLDNMTDTTLRNSLAYELFGENAINILEVMETSTETIDELNNKQLELGITTEEQAKSAERVKELWDEIKIKFMGVSAQLTESLLPIIETLTQFTIDVILPILTTISGWFAGMTPQQQKFTLFLIALIIFLPKIVSIITAIIGIVKAITIASYGLAGGVGAVSTASLPLQPILLAISAVVLTLCILFAFLTGRSKELTSSLEEQTGMMNELETSYSNMENELDINASQVSENSNSSNVDIHVQIDAYGETEMAEQNAQLVADILAEKINKQLGGKI